MKNTLKMMVWASAVALIGCGGDAPAAASPEAPQSEDSTGGETETLAVEPDREMLRVHVAEHLKLPTNRVGVLAACADTPEFTAGEKRWIADHLPEGDYETIAQVSAALGL